MGTAIGHTPKNSALEPPWSRLNDVRGSDYRNVVVYDYVFNHLTHTARYINVRRASSCRRVLAFASSTLRFFTAQRCIMNATYAAILRLSPAHNVSRRLYCERTYLDSAIAMPKKGRLHLTKPHRS